MPKTTTTTRKPANKKSGLGTIMPPQDKKVEEIKKSIESVDADVKIVTPEPKAEGAIIDKDVAEIASLSTDLEVSKKALDEKVSEAKNETEIIEAIQTEIDKVEKIEKRLEEIANKPSPNKAVEKIDKQNFTAFWNGMNFDY